MNSAKVPDPNVRRFVLGLPVLGLMWFAMSQKQSPPLNIKEVGVEETKALVAAGALILDVRERVQYEFRHLPGAILAPLSELSKAIPAFLTQAIAKPILVYCGDGIAHGPEGTALLNRAGYAGAVNLKPGVEGWASAGLPLEHGKGRTS